MTDDAKASTPRLRQSRIVKLLSEGFILALLGPVGYLAVFAFEAGKANAWGIPIQFVTLNLTVAFAAMVSCALLFWMIYLAADLVAAVSSASKSPAGQAFAPVFAAAMSTAIITWIWWAEKFWLVVVLWCGILLLAAYAFLLPLWTQRRISGYQNKLAAIHSARRARKKAESGSDRQLASMKLRGLAFLALLAIVYGWGYTSALKREVHVVFSLPGEQSKLVVLEQYGDLFVCAPIEEGSTELEPSLRLVTLDDVKGVALTKEKLGHLRTEWPPE